MKIDRERLSAAVTSIVQPLYKGTFSSTDKLFASLKNLVPFGTAEKVQLASQFGFISKPVSGTYAYFLNLLGNSQAPIIISHLDMARPFPANDGETIVYSSGKYHFYAKNDRLYVGKDGVYEEVVMGETLRQFLIALVGEIKIHNHTSGVPGSPTGPPLDVAAFTELQTNNLDNSKILAKDGGRF